MEYQKIINLLDNTPNQPTKFRTKNLAEISDDSRGTYNTNSQVRFKTSVIRSSLCDYSGAYIPVKGTITVALVAANAQPQNVGKKVVFEICAPFIDYINEINKTQIDGVKYKDVIMPMYNLIEYSNNYSKTVGSLWQCYRYEPVLNKNPVLTASIGNNERKKC